MLIKSCLSSMEWSHHDDMIDRIMAEQCSFNLISSCRVFPWFASWGVWATNGHIEH